MDSDGKEVKGVNLEVKNINAEVSFLEEKEVPINVQLKDNTTDTQTYEMNPETITIKGKKEILNTIDYINTEKIDLSSIGVSKKINLIIPENVTSNETTVIIKPKDKESLVQRLIYSQDEIELINNSEEVNASDLGIPDSINVEVQLGDTNTEVNKSDISLYIDLENTYNENKEYTINYKSDITFQNVKIIPSTVKK